jgi:hypothetical protein
MDIGFELEFCHESKKKDLQVDISRLFPNYTWISEYERRRSSVKNYPKDSFSLYRDRTIDADYADQEEHELVTPVWSLDEGIDNLYKLFSWMHEINVTTNKTTGLHFSLSFPGMNIDPKKLIKILPEKKWLRKWNRMNNAWLMPHNLKKKLNLSEKARVISFRNKRYVEFRMCGGKNYHLKFTKIEETITHCVKCLELSNINE